MSAKEFVRAKYPQARCIRYKLNGGGGYNLVWELGFEKGRRLSSGDTAAGAWKNAKTKLKALTEKPVAGG